MSFWEDALDAAMETGEYSEDPEDVSAGLESGDEEDDTCPHGVGFDEECEDCEEEDDDATSK